jgi:hypothetical protein
MLLRQAAGNRRAASYSPKCAGRLFFEVRGTKAYGILKKPGFYHEPSVLKGKEK